MLEHKGFIGKVWYDYEDQDIKGCLVNSEHQVKFSASDICDIFRYFHLAVIDYIKEQTEKTGEPPKPISPDLRIKPGFDLKAKCMILAGREGKPVNAWATDRLREIVAIELGEEKITESGF